MRCPYTGQACGCRATCQLDAKRDLEEGITPAERRLRRLEELRRRRRRKARAREVRRAERLRLARAELQVQARAAESLQEAIEAGDQLRALAAELAAKRCACGYPLPSRVRTQCTRCQLGLAPKAAM